MNRIYRVVWCHIRNTYVVASELASRKKLSGRSKGIGGLVVGSILLGALSFSSVAHAASTSTWDGYAAYDPVTFVPWDDLPAIHTTKRAEAYAAGAFAFGRGAEAGNGKDGRHAIALGTTARAKEYSSVAISARSEAYGNKSIAMGFRSKAHGNNSVALGVESLAQGENSIMLGNGGKNADNEITGIYAKDAIGLGNKVIVRSGATSALVLGNGAEAVTADAIVIGQKAKVSGKDAIALGQGAEATGSNALALGKGAKVSGDNNVAIGAGSVVSGRDTVSFGNVGLTRTLAYVKAGAVNQLSTDAINGSQLWATNQRIETLESNTGDQLVILADNGQQVILNPKSVKEDVSLVLGNGAKATALDDNGQPKHNFSSIVLGNKATVTADRSVAIGDGTISTLDSVVMGSKAKAIDESNMVIIGAGAEGTHRGSTAIGWHSKSHDSGATAIGVSTEALGNYSTAIGASAKTEGGLSVAIGNSASTSQSAYGTVALGYKAQVDAYLSVAIGSESVATEQKTVSFGRVAKEGEKEDLTRRLIHVSKGAITEKSTDSINGSQLYLANKSTVEALGGESKLDAEGNIVGPTYKFVNSSHNNVGDALINLDGRVTTNTTNIDGNTTNIKNILKGEAGIIQVQNGELVVDNEIVGADKAKFNLANKDGSSRVLTGVVAGNVNAASTDAINGSQLYNTNQVIGGSYDTDGKWVAPDYSSVLVEQQVDGTDMPIGTVNTVSSGFKHLNDRVNTNKIDISQTRDDLDLAKDSLALALGGNAGFIANSYTLTQPNYAAALGADEDIIGVEAGLKYVNKQIADIAGSPDLVKLSNDGKTVILNQDLAKEAKNIAFGLNAQAGDDEATAIGTRANATGERATALGVESSATGYQSVAIGYQSEAAADNTIAIGHKTRATGSHSVAFGDMAWAEGDDTFALGNESHAKGSESVAIGSQAKAMGNNSYALGAWSQANGQGAVAIGGSTKANHKGAVAIGSESVAQGEYEVSFGRDAIVANPDEGIEAKDALTRKLTYVSTGAITAASTDAINGSQLFETNKKLVDSLGGGSEVDPVTGEITGPTYSVTNSTGNNITVNNVGAALEAINGGVVNNTTNIAGNTTNINSILSGEKGVVQVSKDKASIIVDQELVKDSPNIAFGLGAEAATNPLPDPSVNGPSYGASAATAIGYKTRALGKGSVALGSNSAALSDSSIAIGPYANASGKGSIALGGGASAGAGSSVAIGQNSSTVYKDSYLEVGKNKYITSDQFNNLSDDEMKEVTKYLLDNDKNMISEVALGSTLKGLGINGNDAVMTRRVTGVAKGRIGPKSTEAINGSQLYATQAAIGGSQNPGYRDWEAPIFMDGIEITILDKDGKPVLDDNGQPKTEKTTGFDTVEKALDSLGNNDKKLADALGGGATLNVDGSITGPTYVIDGNDYDNVGDAITNIDGRVIDNSTKIENITNGTAGLVKLGANDTIVIDEDLAKGYDKFDFAGLDKDGKVIERKLTGVAKGDVKADSVDAINGSQLFDANVNVANIIGGTAKVNAETGKIEGSSFLNNVISKEVAKVDADGKPVVDADGNPVMETISGVATVTEAFDSLGAADQKLVDALGGGATLNVDGSITGPTYVIDGNDYDNVGDAITNIDGRVIDNSTKIENITNGTAGLVKLGANDTIVIDEDLAKGYDKFDFAGLDKDGKVIERKLTGVAKGDVKADSVDAINGSQLFDANVNVANIIGGTAKVNAETGKIEGSSFLNNVISKEVAKVDADGKPVVDADGNPVMETISGVATVTEAFDSLGAADQKLVDALGGGATLNVDGSITGPTYVIDGNDYDNVGDAITNIDGRVIDNSTKIENITNGTAGLVKLGAANTIVIDEDLAKGYDKFDFAGLDKDGKVIERKLTGVAKGDVKADSVDAINGSQLFDANVNVANIIGGTAKVNAETGKIEGSSFLNNVISKEVAKVDADGKPVVDADGNPVMETISGVATVTEAFDSLGAADQKLVDALGGGATVNVDGTITGPKYEINNGDVYNNVGDAITNIDGRVIDNSTKIENITNGTAGLVKLGAANTIVIDEDLAKGYDKFDFAGLDKDGKVIERKLTGVAKGDVKADSVDAINGSQLFDANVNVANIIGGTAKVNAETGKIEGSSFLNNVISKEVAKVDADGKPVVDADGNPVMETISGVATVTEAFDSLGAADQKLVDALGGGATVNVDGTITGPKYEINNGDVYNNVGDAITNIDGRVIDNSTKIENITNGTAGLVKLGAANTIVIDEDLAKGYDKFDFAGLDKDGKVIERKLTGVAKGDVKADSVDAINGSQLFDANVNVANIIGGTAKVNAETGKIEGSSFLNNVISKEVAKVDADGKPVVDADGNPVMETISGVATVTEAFDSLGAADQKLVDALGGGATVNVDGTITGPKYEINNGDVYNNVGDAITNIDGRVIDNSTKIENITNGTAGLVKLGANDTIVIDEDLAKGYDKFDFAGLDKDGKVIERKLTGVAKGDVKADSVDAINGSQLFDANVNVANIIGGTAKVNAETGKIEGSSFLNNVISKEVAKVDADGKPVVDADGNPVMETISGVATVTEAFDSLGAADQKLVDALGGGATVNVDGTITGPKYEINNGDVYNNVGDAITNIDGRVIDNSTKIENITNGTAGLVKLGANDTIVIDEDLAKGYDKFDFAGLDKDGKVIERKLTGVAKGDVKADSVDAINGSQLFDANVNVANIIGGTAKVNAETGKIEGSSFLNNVISKEVAKVDADGKPVVDADGNPVMETISGVATVTEAFDSLGAADQKLVDALGGGATVNVDGTITGPKYEINNGDVYNNVGDAITNIDGRVIDNSTKIENITNGTAGLVKLGANDTIVIDEDLAKGYDKFDFAGLDKDGKVIERKLTGVAKGDVKADSVDAINGSQLFDANVNVANIIGGTAKVNAETGKIEGSSFLNNVISKEVAKVDADGKPVVDADGNPVMETISGVATVTEAFDSLGAADQKLVDALGGGATVNVDGTITGPKYEINNGDVYNNVGDAITNIDGRVIDNSTKIEDITNNITTGKAGLVQLDGDKIVIDNNAAKSANTFDISNGDVNRKLEGVADGRIGAGSTEAVTGGQLYSTGKYLVDSLGAGAVYNLAKGEFGGLNFQRALKADEEIATVEDGFAYLKDNLQAFEDGEIGLLQLKDGKLVFSDKAVGATFDITDGKDARTLTGVKAGAVTETSLDAINGSQLHATNKSIVDALGGDAELNEDGSIKGPTYVINGDNYNNVGDAITNIDGRVIDNTKNITNLTENINNINSGKSGLVMIDGDRIVFDNSIAGNRTFDISNNGQARNMTGVADGNIAAGSKDAVNGGQLYDTNQNVATNTDNIGKNTDALGGGAGIDKDGNYTGPNYSFNDGSNHTNVGSALDNLDGRVTDLDKKVDGITNGTEGLVKLETDENGNQKLVIDNNLASNADTFDISNGDDGRTLTGVNDGKVAEGSKDAINGGQLHDSNKSIADIFGGGASIDQDGYVSMPEYDFGDANKFNNVGDSLAHLNNKIQNGEGGLFQMSADGKTVILSDAAKDATTVNMGDRVIAGVANGKIEQGSMEAVNGGQLWETNQQVSTNTNQIKHINNTLNHYNTRINNLEKTVHENRKRASAGTASAMAMSSIPYLDYAKYSFGMGVASYDGEAAMSMGLEFKMGDNGRFRIQGSYDTQNKAGVGVGMAFEL